MDLMVDGKRVFVATGGREPDPTLPAVVLLHGAGMDHTVWVQLSRYLAGHGCTVLVPCLPGHGQSAGPTLATIPEAADWVARLLDAAGIARASLVGHSMGGAIALETAARHPARVRSLLLVGTAAALPVHPALMAAARDNSPAAFDMIVDWGHGAAAKLGGNIAPGVSITGAARAVLAACPPGVLATDLAACAAWTDGKTAAARVSAPTLVVAGAEDRMTPARKAADLASLIAGARLESIERSGHMIMLEAPMKLRDAAARHFASLATSQ
jgi:pimeloyl-ACP methyl ester carboxylesterase